MNPMNQPNDPRPSLDPILDASDLRMARALDTLGRAEREAAPASLEAAAYDASIPALRAAAGAGPVAMDVVPQRIQHPAGHTPAIAGRIAPSTGRIAAAQSRRRIAIAAGLGAIACAGGLWVALQGNSTAPDGSGTPLLADAGTGARAEPIPAADPDAELEAMLLASSLFSTGLSDEIDSISASAASLGLSLTDPIGGEWSDPLWTGESL